MNPKVCVLWAASDVLMCTASIWHMSTMSMDRYFTLKYPMRYGRNKTRRMVAGKILFVWVVSFAISSPVYIYGFMDISSVFQKGDCVPTMKNFIFYGSIFAFYIPLLIMIVTYVLTIIILWKNQQRMRNIDRSDLKPRLAQLTAQCTGLAIPKLLTNLKKVSKSPSTPASLSYATRSEKQLLAPGTSAVLANRSCGNINTGLCETDLSEEGDGGRRHLGVTYLVPPSSQVLSSRSLSPVSAHLPMYSDTEESESEPSYFSLVPTHQSTRSLYSPISQTNSERSLHRRLQKKQLCCQQQKQKQQQELQQLNQECQQQHHLFTNNYQETTHLVTPVTPNEDMGNNCDFKGVNGVPSNVTLASSPISPLFEDNARSSHQNLHQMNNICTKPVSTIQSLATDSPTVSDKKSPKKKRFSKRCKKRRNSLTQNSRDTDHLKVPGQTYFRHGVISKQSNGQAVLASAVSDTQVSKAGRDMSCEEKYLDVSAFHLSRRNLGKDYKSVEWDRRYFQIQEEMDRCLEEGFARCDRHTSKQARISDIKPETGPSQENGNFFDQKTLLKPEASLPVYLADPLNVTNDHSLPSGVYSRSAPNSPVNRRAPEFMKLVSSSDDEREDNTSDKNDDDNETSGSSNSDVITIRLHPPTPKLKCSNALNNSKLNKLAKTCQGTSFDVRSDSLLDIVNVRLELNTAQNVHHFVNKEQQQNGFPCFASNADNGKFIPAAITTTTTTIKNSNSNNIDALRNGASLHNLSSGGSPLPEMVISSEGEMTLDETDDTLDDSSSHQQIKLRRPQNLQNLKHKVPKKYPPLKQDFQENKYVKYKRPSFRNTFRIHRGKAPVKHILSKKTATNEKKASKVLGIIFLVFVVLWTPFFAVNILNTICESCISNVSKEVMSLFLWMGYVASLANPIIYTMFNTAFRRTFIKILTCKIQRTCRSKSSDTHYMSYTTMLASERRNTMTVVLREESK